MADFPQTQSGPTKEHDVTAVALPEGHRTAEQRMIAESAYQQHSRRESQEEHLILQEVSNQNQLVQSGGSSTATTRHASRSREQNNQLAQQEEHAPKQLKRGKNRRGESDTTLQQLTSIVGPDTAESIVCAVEEASKKHGSGLTVNPGDLKQLAKELAVTLKGSAGLHTLGITATEPSEIEKIILTTLTERCCEHKGTLTPQQVVEGIVTCRDRKDSHSHAEHDRVNQITSQVGKIVAASSTPVEEMIELKERLSTQDKELLFEAITRIEIDQECSLLHRAIARYPRTPEVYSVAVDTFVDNLVDNSQRETYTKTYLSRAMEAENLTYNSLLEERAEVLKVIAEHTATLKGVRMNFLERVAESEKFFNCTIFSKDHLWEYENRSVTLDTFIPSHEKLVSEYTVAIERLLAEQKIKEGSPEFLRFSAITELLQHECKTLTDLHLSLCEALSAAENLQSKIVSFWSEFSTLHKRAFEKAKIPTPQMKGVGYSIEPYFSHHSSQLGVSSLWSSLSSDGIIHKKIVTLDTLSNYGKHESEQDIEEKSHYELREEADREGRISIEIAKHFAFNGDFANAEAAVSAHNNRFPEFQISRDFIREIKEKLAKTNGEKASTEYIT